MRTLVVIGIGTGNPEHITVEGIKALGAVDVVFIPTKGEEKDALASVRREICARHIANGTQIAEFALPGRDANAPDYEAGVDDWHDRIALQYAGMISDLGANDSAALLVWGDPGLYDSTLRILERVRSMGAQFEVKVLPGITAIQALTSAFAIPLNTIGNPVVITTGRKLAAGWPDATDSVVVMLDGQKRFAQIDPAGLYIWWGAYVGMAQQILIEGPLTETKDKIIAARDAARAANGWIMDVYLLRKE